MRMTEHNTPEPPPIVDLSELTEIAAGVWIIPDRRVRLVPNIGIIEGERSVLVVDTGMGPSNAATVLAKAREIAAGRPLTLTLTHFHPEHGFGAQTFAGEATIVYNHAQRDELREKGPGYLELFRTFGPGVAACLSDVELVDPDIVYRDELTLDLGGREVELRSVGPAHTRGDQIVWLPEERVVFAGDLIERQVFPIFPYFPPDDADVDGGKWLAVLGRIAALEPRIVVTGHCEVGGPELITITADYLRDLGERVMRLRSRGLDADAAVAELAATVRAEHPDWREPDWIEQGIRSFHATGFRIEAAAASAP
jgi:glyoxylase-like metal-dependent hydrolase (beta-lactamase superfamily II)